jgi:spore coat protein CotF
MKNWEFIDESHKEVEGNDIFEEQPEVHVDDKEFAERMHLANENIAKALKWTKPVTTTPPLTK